MHPNMMTNEEEMQLTIGHGHVLYTGGADGTDTLAEEMARERLPIYRVRISSWISS